MTKRVLLVEDSQDDVELALRAFRKSGVSAEISVANDGAEALEYLMGVEAQVALDTRALPQVVLLDLKLPRMDGLEVLRRLRAHDPTSLLPIVILTSSVEESDVISSYRLGANSYLRKPVDAHEFQELMRQVSVYWLQLNRTSAPI